MIGRVGMILGDAGLNIDDMDVGTGPGGDAALMAISLAQAVPTEVVERVRAEAGVDDARAIELG
jgi:D-3-phosphoglycerate dehydrogenase